VPVVATRLSGIPELVRDGDTGLLVEPGDAPALAAALTSLLENDALAAELAVRARRLVEDSFSLNGETERLGDLLAESIARGPELGLHGGDAAAKQSRPQTGPRDAPPQGAARP
jgi:glycosyltransferase involved in cell wall biosynthesis